MISHEYQCIFIHIPKCAGTSIESAFGHLEGHFGRNGQDHRTIRGIERPLITRNLFSSTENIVEVLRRSRCRFRDTGNPRNRITVTREQYESYFKFAFVRNPWARAYSWYRNVMRDEIHKKNLGASGQISLTSFLRRYSTKGMLRPQTFWIKDYSGTIPLDYVGRFENLRKDFKEVCSFLRTADIMLPHKIPGRGEDYREYYDKASIKIVREAYKEEIEMFGYSFES